MKNLKNRFPDALVNKFYVALCQTIMEISKTSFLMYTGIEEVEVKPLSSKDLTYDHWIIYMVTGCPGINIGYSCHFSSKTARSLAEEKLKIKPLTSENCHDFIGEYCNVSVGGIKNALSTLIPLLYKKESEASISTPEKKPSYDESNIEVNDTLKKHYWVLSWKGEELVLSINIEIKETEFFKNYNESIEKLIENISTYRIDQEGGIELF